MKRKFLLFAMFLFLIFAFPIKSQASSDVRIWIEGNFVESDVPAYIDQDRTMIPIRLVSENLGKEVIWNEEDPSTIIIKETDVDKADKSITMHINEKSVSLSQAGEQDKELILDHAPELKQNRTFVPLRNVAELFDKKVSWDQENRVAVVGEGYSPSKDKKSSSTKDYLPYLYNKKIAKASLEEQLDFEKNMGKQSSKDFPGHTNKDVEVAIAWLSCHKSGYLDAFGKEGSALDLLLGRKLGYAFTNKGESLGVRTLDSDPGFPRRFTGVYNDDAMASLIHFEYYPNFDGSINAFFFPLHDHFETREETINTYQEIFNNPTKITLDDFSKDEIQAILDQIEINSYYSNYDD